MEENNANFSLNEDSNGQLSLFENEEQLNATEDSEEIIKSALEEQLKKVSRQNFLIGAQTICYTVLEKITAAMNQPGKRSMNDYKRLIKDIESFCRTGLSRKVNTDGETEPMENNSETTQNEWGISDGQN